MKVYTKTGDKGTTSLVGGSRVAKDHPRLEAYGTIDELMAQTAYLRDNMTDENKTGKYKADLLTVLDHLMRAASHLAAEETATKYLPEFGNVQVEFLEKSIDDIQATLLPITKFTLPGGHPLVSLCHICRTVCRRSERAITALARQYAVKDEISQYVNRLSDYFYVLGRKLSEEFNVKEIYWVYDK